MFRALLAVAGFVTAAVLVAIDKHHHSHQHTWIIVAIMAAEILNLVALTRTRTGR